MGTLGGNGLKAKHTCKSLFTLKIVWTEVMRNKNRIVQ